MSAPVTPAPEVVQGQAPLSEPQRIANIFHAPTRTFSDIRRSAKWWGPFLVMVVMSYVGAFAIQQKVGAEQLAENIYNNMSEKQKDRIEQAPPEQQARIRASIARNTQIISYLGWVIYLVVALIIAAALMATFNFGLGKEVRYGAAIAIVLYSFLPSAIKSILLVVTLYAGADPATFNVENPVATNIGFFMSPNASPALYRLLTALDIFTIWQAILLGMGFAVVSKTKKSTGIAVVFGWLAFVTLCKMGFAVMF